MRKKRVGRDDLSAPLLCLRRVGVATPYSENASGELLFLKSCAQDFAHYSMRRQEGEGGLAAEVSRGIFNN